MNIGRRVDAVDGWWSRCRLGREIERRWYRSRLSRLIGESSNRGRNRHYHPHHLYEMVISNDHLWLKLQASCWSSRQAVAFMEARFNGTRYVTADGYRPVTPFRLSECSNEISNWASIIHRLPEEWDNSEYRIERYPYSWCDRLSEGCNCHANKGRRGIVVCADYGSQEEGERKQTRTGNAFHKNHIAELESRIEKQDEAQRVKRSPATSRPVALDRSASFVYPKVSVEHGADRVLAGVPPAAMDRIGQMVSAGYYCCIEKRHHPYGRQAIRRTVASLNAAFEKMLVLDDESRRSAMSHMASAAEHYLRAYQSEECAKRSVWGQVEVPGVLYKYVPLELIGNGAPNSLRATQLLALNDNMECNVITMKDVNESMLDMLRIMKEKSKNHLGTDIAWDELLQEPIRYGSPRLSPFIQRYLNPLVGVVLFSTDIYVPTMWAHYSRNTGVVVGYNTETLRTLGFELQPVIYSEIAPIYRPLSGDDVELDFVDREYMEGVEKSGRR